jgi:hypothetical protein
VSIDWSKQDGYLRDSDMVEPNVREIDQNKVVGEGGVHHVKLPDCERKQIRGHINQGKLTLFYGPKDFKDAQKYLKGYNGYEVFNSMAFWYAGVLHIDNDAYLGE